MNPVISDCYRIHIRSFIYFRLDFYVAHTHTLSAQWKSINLIDWVAKCSVACMQHMRTCRRNNVCNWTPNVGALNVIWSQSPSVPLISHIFLSKINVLHSSVLCTWKHTHTHDQIRNLPICCSFFHPKFTQWLSLRDSITWSPTIMAFFSLLNSTTMYSVRERIEIPSRVPRPHNKNPSGIFVALYTTEVICVYSSTRLGLTCWRSECRKNRLKKIN